MKSSPSRILKGKDVEGIMFCSPKSTPLKEEPNHDEEEDNLKALEKFWYEKGLKDGSKKGFDEGAAQSAKENYEKGHEEGFKKGLEEGTLEGIKEGEEQTKQEAKNELIEALEFFKSSSEKILEEKNHLLLENHNELVELSLKICEKILQNTLNNPENFRKIIDQLLQRATSIAHSEKVQVIVSPEDLQMIESTLESVQYEKHNINQLDFIADPDIPRKSIRIESSLGLIHFDVAREIEHLKDEIRLID